MSRTRRRLALAAILALATALRFLGLGWGLRQAPHHDEREFVENARRMVAERSLDHRFYEYPGLFFYLIAPALALLPAPAREGAQAYWLVRGIVAAFGVASVGLVFRLGERLMGPRAGLVAALLLAVSRADVVTAHMVRPDLVLGSFALLAAFTWLRLGPDPGGDWRAGAVLGAATAVKFTGLLLAPSYVLARWLAPGPRGSRIVLAGVAAVLVGLAFTPYALIHAAAFFEGIHDQLAPHYQGGSAPAGGGGLLWYYLRSVPWSFGGAAVVAMAVGLVAGLGPGWRRWAPIVLHPVVTIGVMSTADIGFRRQLVPTTGLLALLAARGFEAVARRLPGGSAWLAVLIAAAPAANAWRDAWALAQPGPKDRALDFIADHAPDEARIATAVDNLGLDATRYEAVRFGRWEREGRLLSREVDLLVLPADEAPAAAPLEQVRFPGRPGSDAGDVLAVLWRPTSASTRESLRIDPRWLASSDPGDLAPLVDQRLDTLWRSEQPQRAGCYLEVAFPEPRSVSRVELVAGPRLAESAPRLALLASDDGARWRAIETVAGRPALADQIRMPRSQVWLFDPVTTRRLRLVRQGGAVRRWAAAELRLDATP